MMIPRSNDRLIPELSKLLEFKNGIPYWNVDRHPKRKGDKAGSVKTNSVGMKYIRIGFKGKHVYAHRVAYYIYNGIIAENIDHADGNALNNTPENLRSCVHSKNIANCRANKRKNKSGYKGVYASGNRWVSQLRHDNKLIYIGIFKTREDAAKQYDLCSARKFGMFSVLNSQLMPSEFVNMSVGVPWVNRGSTFEGVDCWSVVTLYFHLVHDIQIPIVQGYSDGSTPIADGFFQQAESGWWRKEPGPSDGLVFAAFHGDIPAHVGVITGGRCLHCLGSDDKPGSVGYHSIRTLEKLYSRLEYWRYVGNDCNPHPSG